MLSYVDRPTFGRVDHTRRTLPLTQITLVVKWNHDLSYVLHVDQNADSIQLN